MQETKPLLILGKYRSILLSALAVEVVSFAVSLTDSIVAGNIVGADAFAAIGLMSPFFSIATFVTAVFNSGTVNNYNSQIGLCNKDRACEFFSQGVVMAVGSGVLLTAVLLLARGPIIAILDVPPSRLEYLNEYYDIIVFYFMLAPISALLDNMVISDGGEGISAVSNIVQIAGNVVLSVVMAKAFGIRGIALATVSCKALFVVLISLWFSGRKNTIRFVKHFTKEDAAAIIRRGIVRAVTFAMTALMTFLLNSYILHNYDDTVFEIWVVVQKLLGLSSLFIGISMTMQPLIVTLKGEKNTKATRALARRANLDVAAVGLIITAVIQLFPTQTLGVFGIKGGSSLDAGVDALRICSLLLPFMATTVFFFIYYWLIDRELLAILVSFLNDLACPLALVMLAHAVAGKSTTAMWWGLTIAYPAAQMIIVAVVHARYGRKQGPLLIPAEPDNWIHIFAFRVTDEKIMSLTLEVQDILRQKEYSERTQYLANLCVEDLLMLVKEKNEGNRRPLYAECTLTMEEEGVRLVIRDTGVIFDLTDEDADVDSFLQYTVAGILSTADVKTYIVTTGFNRNEFFIEEKEEKKETED